MSSGAPAHNASGAQQRTRCHGHTAARHHGPMRDERGGQCPRGDWCARPSRRRRRRAGHARSARPRPPTGAALLPHPSVRLPGDARHFVEDLAQEGLRRRPPSAAALQGHRPPLRGVRLRHRRAQGRRPAAGGDASPRLHGGPVRRDAGAPGRLAGPEERALLSSDAEWAKKLLANLPENQRELLLLRIAVGLTAEETGQMLGMSPARSGSPSTGH